MRESLKKMVSILQNLAIGLTPIISINIEREYSFSELLEGQVSEKYFLSQKAKERILKYKDNRQIPLQEDTSSPRQLDRILLNVNSMHKSKTCTSTEASRTESME